MFIHTKGNAIPEGSVSHINVFAYTHTISADDDDTLTSIV